MTLVPNAAWQDAWDKHIQLQQVQRPVIYDQDQAYRTIARASTTMWSCQAPATTPHVARATSTRFRHLSTVFASLNWAKAPFDNLEVRQAFALSLNKQILVDRIEQGAGAPSNHFVPRGMPGYNVNLKNPPPDGTQSLTGNQTAATTLLKKAQDSCPASGNFFAQALRLLSLHCQRRRQANTGHHVLLPPGEGRPGSVGDWRGRSVEELACLNVKAAGLDDSIFFGKKDVSPPPRTQCRAGSSAGSPTILIHSTASRSSSGPAQATTGPERAIRRSTNCSTAPKGTQFRQAHGHVQPGRAVGRRQRRHDPDLAG